MDLARIAAKAVAATTPRAVGQWIGSLRTEGLPSPGVATLSIETVRPDFAFACIDQMNGLPPSRLDLEFVHTKNTFTAKSLGVAHVFDWQKGILVPTAQHTDAGRFTVSERIFVEGTIEDRILRGVWSGDSGASGSFDLRNGIGEPSVADETVSWSDFKSYCAALVKQRREYVFRGQASSTWDLRTTLHREERYDLVRYETANCAPVVRELSGRMGRRYNLTLGNEFGAVLSLAQHHGFPTPLLDWTRSPYVAAYFAVSGMSEAGACPRVFVFDAGKWSAHVGQPANLSDPRPAVSIREFEAYDNPRHFPQQSCHTFSNVADIAGWIRQIEGIRNERYLTVIDITHDDRGDALSDLAYMGVTAATLFPGLDGVCRTLKERMFGVR